MFLVWPFEAFVPCLRWQRHFCYIKYVVIFDMADHIGCVLTIILVYTMLSTCNKIHFICLNYIYIWLKYFPTDTSLWLGARLIFVLRIWNILTLNSIASVLYLMAYLLSFSWHQFSHVGGLLIDDWQPIVMNQHQTSDELSNGVW